ncbi:MAG: hypothetical protein ABSE16_14795 [Verrucomicrobiota bacterium]|jgi:hypothetical protein
MRFIRRHLIRFGRPAFAALLVALVILLDAMAACPALHELIHKDAGHADHDCAVTMFAQGKVDSAIVEILVVVTAVFVVVARRIQFSVFQPAIEHLPLGRAPPPFCSVS